MRQQVRSITLDVAELTDPGRDPSKQVNEDSVGYFSTQRGHLAVVCDGMGGHTAGREASRLALATIAREVDGGDADIPAANLLRHAVEAANAAVFDLGRDAPLDLRPGSTCVATLIHEHGAEVVHVGDSRMYLIHAGRISRVTRDHSMVQQMVDAGVLSEAEAAGHPEANKITRALGIGPQVHADVRPQPIRVAPGDVLLLASDGLTDLLTDDVLRQVVEAKLPSGVEEVCRTLVRLANERGGHDNITAQVLHVIESPHRQTASTTRSEASDTLVDHTLELAPERPVATAPSPTLIDDSGSDAQRTTQPGALGRPGPGFWQSHVESEGATPRLRQARTVVLAAALLCGVIVLGIGIWWAFSAASSETADEVVPPPEAEQPEPIAVPRPPVTTVLEASVEPEPVLPNPTASPVPAAPGPAPDASLLGPDGGAGP